MNTLMDATRIVDRKDEWTTSGSEGARWSARGVQDERLLFWSVCGTSGSSTIADDARGRFLIFLAGTSAGSFVSSRPSLAQSAVVEIRQRSQLTWEQLARVFGVQRRSLHFWARGARPSSENVERILRVLAIVRHVDKGDTERTQAELLHPRGGGVSVFDLLCAGRDEDVQGLLRGAPRALAAASATKWPRRPPSLGRGERERRRGFTPVELLDARHDHTPSLGRSIGAASVPGYKA